MSVGLRRRRCINLRMAVLECPPWDVLVGGEWSHSVVGVLEDTDVTRATTGQCIIAATGEIA